jgi:glycosyltransferase involved in cell wall biosynthesis
MVRRYRSGRAGRGSRALRVLQIQTYHFYRGGDSTYMFNLSGLLERNGHEVAHFAMHHPENLPSPFSKYFVSEIDFPSLLDRPTPASALRVLGRSIHSGEARGNITRLIREWRPDVAHIHNIHAHLTTSILAPLRKARVPTVWTLHDYRLVCPNSNLLSGEEICERCMPNRFYHVVLRRCKKGSLGASLLAMVTAFYDRLTRLPTRIDRFIAPSDFLKNKLVEGGFDPGRITCLPNFLDVDSYGPSPAKGYFLYFGRLSFEKGVDLLIRATARLGRGSLRILGEGPARLGLEGLAAEVGASNIMFLGHRSGEELRRILSEAQFVVLPSRWYENLPFSIMEAFASAKPVVASDLGGIPEMVDDGVNGYLFTPGDVDALAGLLERLLGDPRLAEEMGRKGREKAMQLYTAEHHYERVMEIYRDITGRTGA